MEKRTWNLLFPLDRGRFSRLGKSFRLWLFDERDWLNLTWLLKWVKSGLNKWRIAFLIIALIYAAFLILNLAYMSAQWDEVVHLDGGLFLLRGNIHQFQAWNSFYPPMYDFLTTGFFALGGASLFMGRLVSVVFSLLSVMLSLSLLTAYTTLKRLCLPVSCLL